ncbi:MAG: filamentous hemagglutinin N-terminal domain-containing protein [Symploca sp. SIO1A3]|nr:filamentous hemagglutinin N-terminal domain-containing protein [Symploca sp. SIO1A3]
MIHFPRILLGFPLVFSLLTVKSALAQLIPDNSLGRESSVVEPLNQLDEQINGGAIRGGNLFHSFLEFNVGAGKGVYFANPMGIENILSRVTGANPSHIWGRLGVLGDANLFLLNPNGIFFGQNATLDINGSFLATTADAIQLGSQGLFSATEPHKSSLLAVEPGALFFNQVANQSGTIVNAGNLTVETGENLTLVGGSINNTGQLRAAGGEITVAAVSNNQQQITNNQQPTVGTVSVSGIIDTSNPENGQLGGTVQVLGDKIGLLQRAQINASGDAGGGTVLIGGNYQGQGTLPQAEATYVAPEATINADAINTGDGGLIVVWANESTRAYGKFSAQGGIAAGNGGLIETSGLTFLDVSGIKVDATATNGFPGTWLIDPRNITIQNTATANGNFSNTNPNIFTPGANNAVVNTQDIATQLNAGTNVTITTGSTGTQEGNITVADSITKTAGGVATLTLAAANDIIVNSGVEITSNSNALNIFLTADSDNTGGGDVVMTNGIIQAKSGQVAIAGDSILLEGTTIASDTTGSNDGGAITFAAANSLSLLNNSQITSNTSSDGNAGRIEVTANSISLVNNSDINSGTEVGSTGNAGAITIIADSLVANNGSGAGTNTNGSGIGGQLNITVEGLLSIEDSSGFGSDTFSDGNAGEITIQAGRFLVANGSGAGTNTTGTGNGGRITIYTQEMSLQQSGFGSNAFSDGNAGEVTIHADRFVMDQSGVGTNTRGQGNGGRITINAGELLMRDSGLGSETFSDGNAGEITINVGRLLMDEGTDMSTNTGGAGNAGIITIDAEEVLLLGNSEFASNARSNSTGNAGEIRLNVRSSLTLDNSNIGTSSQGEGKAGNISITSQNLLLNQGAITAESTQAGGGDITIDANNIRLRNSSLISSSVFDGTGGGGTIAINSSTFLALEDSDILANADQGAGGNITINSEAFLANLFTSGQTLAVSSNPGNFDQFRGNGRVDISAISQNPNTDLTGIVTIPDSSFLQHNLSLLSEKFIDPEQAIANSCLTNSKIEQGSFTVTGTSGLPPTPNNAFSSQYRLRGVQPVNENRVGETSQQTQRIENSPNRREVTEVVRASNTLPIPHWQLGDPVIEAQGMLATADGRILLGSAPQLTAMDRVEAKICFE